MKRNQWQVVFEVSGKTKEILKMSKCAGKRIEGTNGTEVISGFTHRSPGVGQWKSLGKLYVCSL